MSQKCIVFFIGTVAEYIKLFPVLEEVKKKGIAYRVISSGQNRIDTTDIARITALNIDLSLSSEEDIVKNVFGLFYWFFNTTAKSKRIIKEKLKDIDFENSVMVVHGDTLSTVMGALLGKRLKMKVAHIEAGLRSGRLFTPFPEELDRLFVSRLADYNFCQGETAVNNLKKSKGEVVNTKYNTIIDAITYAKTQPSDNAVFDSLESGNYGVFVLHRQENLLNHRLVNKVVDTAIQVSKKQRLVFVMNQITEDTLKKLKLYNKLCSSENIIAVRRMDYFDFMKLLIGSEFVITDGGSNQEELSYMGKPTLILRTATERSEGIGENALLYGGDFNEISRFVETYHSYNRSFISAEASPSEIICDYLSECI